MTSIRALASALLLGLAAASSALAQNASSGSDSGRNLQTIGTCDLAQPIEVEASAGTPGPTGYATLRTAFDAINLGTHQGAINIEVCASTVEGTTPATLNSSGAGAALYSALSIRPLVDGLSISGNPATGFGVIQLKGADNVTIDGDNLNTAGTNRNLTVANTNTATAIAGSVIRIATAATVLSADNNIIRNLVLNGNVNAGNAVALTLSTGSSNSSFVIYAGGNGGSTATDAPTAITSVTTNSAPSGTTINNLVISNNAVNLAARGIVFNGANATVASSLTISDNLIGAAGLLLGPPPYPAPSGTVYTKGIWIAGANGISISNNSLRNILSYVATTMTGIELSAGIGAVVTISNNTINTVVQNGTSNVAKGIQISSATGSYSIVGNTIANVQTLGAASGNAGMDLGGTVTSALVERNQISTVYNRNAGTFGAWGLSISAGTSVTVRNNFISDINGNMTAGNAFSTTFGLVGLRIAGGTAHQIFNNSVNLSGALLANGTGVLSAACAIASTGQTNIDMRNNICANTLSGSVASTSHVSLFLPTAGTSAMNLTLNTSDYFSGADPATQGIAQVGATFGTGFFLSTNFNAGATTPVTNLRNYTDTLRASSGNDSVSLVSNPSFVSALDLHIVAGSPAQNAGATISSVANDIDAQLRPGGSGYDIGADEVDGLTPPANDFGAVALIDPASGGAKPVNVAFVPQASFTNFGTTTQTNVTVRYRIVNASLVEVYNQTAIIASLAFNASQIVSFPAATISSAGTYSIFARAELFGDTVPANNEVSGTLQVAAPLSGIYTVGAGGNFASLTNAGGLFQVANQLGVSGNLSVTITGNLSAETGSNSLNETVGGFTVSIRPAAGVSPVVSGAASACLVRLNGADNVTIDGSNTVGGTSRDLTFNNTSTSTASAVLCVSSLGAGAGASNNTLRNLNVLGNDPTQTLVGISLGGATPGSTGTNNDNNRVENNRIRRSVLGIYNAGASATLQNTGTVITLNDLSGTGSERVRRGGILIFNENGIQVTRNDIGGMDTIETADAYGIGLGTQSIDAVSTASGGVTNALVARNRINGVAVALPSDFSAAGIAVAGGATGANVIANNFVSGVVSNATPSDFPVGIFVAGATGSSTRLYYNSVLMSLERSNTSTQTPSYGIAITGADPTVELKNNIIANTQNAPNGGPGAKNYAIGLAATTFVNLDANYNLYFASGTNLGYFRTGSLGTSAGVDYATIDLWRTAISDDANSPTPADPLYVSATDLHLQAASPAANLGTPIGAVTNDFDGNPRSATTPEIGADELVALNTPPSITPAVGLTRQAGSASGNSTIAVVNDAEQAPGSLIVTAPSVPAGLTLSTITNSSGIIAADLAASCTATVGANVVGLSVSDGSSSTPGNLSINVTANAAPILGSYPASNAIAGAGTTVLPTVAPSDNGSVASLSASAPGFTGTLSGNAGTGVVTVSNAGPASGTPYLVTVTATDNCGATSTTTFNLTVTAANTAPSITAASGVTRQQGSALSNSGIATVSDAQQAAGSLTVTAPSVPAGLTLSSIVNSNGAVSANLLASCTATLGANTIGLSVSDGALSSAANLSVNVTANSAPTVGLYPAGTVTTGGSTSVTPGSAPADNGSVATLTAAAPSFTGTLVGNVASGVISVSNAGPASGTPYLVTVTATDNCGATTTSTFNLTVNAANTAPTLTPASGVSRQQGSAPSNSTIATVADAESGAGTLVVTAPSVPAGLTVAGIVNSAGTVTANLSATCAAPLGAASVGLSVSDGSLSTAGNLPVNVTANTAPTLAAYPASSVTVGGATSVTPSGVPVDNGSVSTLSASAPGFTGTLSGNAGTGVITVSNAGPASGTPYLVTVTATDNCGATTTSTFNLTVNAANTAPTLTPASGVTRQQGSAPSNSTIATVADAESGAGTLVVTAPSVPAGLTVAGIANVAGTVTANLSATCAAPLGAASVGLSVSDGSLSTAGNLPVNVTANTAPTLAAYPASSVTVGGATSVTPSGVPVDNGSVSTLSASAPGFAGTFTGNPATGVITLSNAGPASAAPYLVTVTATDNCGLTSTVTFNLTVGSVATTLTLSGPATARVTTPVSYTFGLAPAAANGTVTISSGALSCVVNVPTATPSCALTFPTVGVRSVSATFAPADTGYAASTSNTVSTTVHFSADLAVSKDNGVSTYRVGDLLVYTIVLRNLGPDAAPGAVLTDNVPAGLVGATWTCVASGGAVCPQAAGSGNINATVATLPANGSLTYTLQANVASPLPPEIVNTAQVALGGPFIVDPNLSNQSATDRDLPDAIFRNGFEDAARALINQESAQVVLPLSALRALMDGTARALLSYDDTNGEAIRLYGRIVDGRVELAIAQRDSAGLLRLGAWQQFDATEATLTYRAVVTSAGWVLQSTNF